MTVEEFEALGPGDIVMPAGSDTAAIVTANYGGRVTAVRTFDLTNPEEWTLIRKVKSVVDDRLIVEIEVRPSIVFDARVKRLR